MPVDYSTNKTGHQDILEIFVESGIRHIYKNVTVAKRENKNLIEKLIPNY